MSSKESLPGHTNHLSQIFEAFGFGRFGLLLIVAVSFNWFVDGMELTLSSIISPILKHEWKLTSFQEAFISSGVYFGAGVGSLLFGFLSDKHGRKWILILGSSITMYFAFLGIASNNFVLFFTIRFFAGLGIGTISISTPYIAEFLAVRYRARCIITLELFFALGNTFASVMAYVFVSKYGWRVYLTSLAIPIPFLIALIFFLPESLSYMQKEKDINGMNEAIYYIAKLNKCQKMPNLISCIKNNEKTDIVATLCKKYWKRLLLCGLLFTLSGMLYYGVIYYGTQIYALNNKSIDNNTYYIYNALTTLGEFPGIIIYTFLIRMIDRKKLMTISYLLQLFFYIFININMSNIANTITLLIFRGIGTANLQLSWCLATELFPTNIRGISLGICLSLQKFSLIFVPFLVQWLTTVSMFLSPAIFIGFSLAGVLCSRFIPAEALDIYIDDQEGN